MEKKIIRASILIRAYNAEATIERALKSALGQTYSQPYEIVVVNDGSNDGTKDILERYRAYENVRIIHQSNQGAGVASKRALEESGGEFVTFLDSDDEFEPTLLEELAGALDSHREYTYAYSDYFEVQGGKRSTVSPANVFETVAVGMMFRREVLKGVGYFNMQLIFPEYDLQLRVLDQWCGYHCNKPLFTYYRSLTSITGDKAKVDRGIRQLRELHPDKLSVIALIRPY